MTTTALQIITRTARLIGAVRKSESLSADEAADGLVTLNDMLGSWSNDSLSVYARVRESFTLTASASFSIGAAQTFNTVKPIKIVEAFIRSGSIDYPLEIISDEEYDGFAIKTTAGGPSEYLSYNNGHPYGTIFLYPVPTSGDALHLLSEKVLTSLPALTTVVNLPAGTNEAICYNLGLRFYPEYGMRPDPLILQLAKESLGAIRLGVARNRPMPYMPDDVEIRNIYTGWA